MAPSEQGFGPDELAVGEPDRRLVEEPELVAVERVAQCPLGLEANDHMGAQGRVEDLGACPAALLRSVHRGIGVAQERLGSVVGSTRQRDPDARGRDHDAPVRQRDGLGQRAREPFRHDPRVVFPAQALADDHELVATEPRDRVRSLQAPLDPPRDLDEQLVTGVVPQAVVDHLEAVDVEEQHGDLAGAPREAEESLAEAVEEERAIRQPGQRIVERLVLESVLGVGPVHGDGGERGDPLDDRDVDEIRVGARRRCGR